MEDTIARYEQEIQELERSRKEILKKAKEEAERLLQESNAKIEIPFVPSRKRRLKRNVPARHVRN